MNKNSEQQIKDIFKQVNSSRKEKISAQLDRLIFLEQNKVIKFHEIAQMDKLRRELAEIEFSERNRPRSNPPSSLK